MSFSKAKIHRFNDEIPCAPPPGTYNPEVVNKNVGPVIYKTERFSDRYSSLFSSTESLNSLNGGTDNCRSSYVFKMPRLPSAYSRTSCNSALKHKMDFSCQKAASSECILKSDCNGYEVNTLKNSLNMVHEELNVEKNKSVKLTRDLKSLRREFEESENFSSSLIDVIGEKDNLLVLLEEKSFALQNTSNESFQSYHEHVRNVFSIFQSYSKMWSDTDTEKSRIIEEYQRLLTEYEKDFEKISTFFIGLLEKYNEMKYMEYLLHEPENECINHLVNALKSTQSELKKYKIGAPRLQEVINQLTNRVLESDREVYKKEEELLQIVTQNMKLTTDLRKREEEIETMQNNIENVTKSFVEEVQLKEKELLKLVDEFKEEALNEKDSYEQRLAEKNEAIFELLAEKNQKELELQESLDQLEILKCKEETLVKLVDHLREEAAERRSSLEKELKEYREKVAYWEKFYERHNTSDENSESSESNSDEKRLSPIQLRFKNDEAAFGDFVKMVTLFVSNKVAENDPEINSFSDEITSKSSVDVISKILIENFTDLCPEKQILWMQNFLNFIYEKFCILDTENLCLRNDFMRLHSDLVEKCEECAQLTRLLQLSEKNVENSEKKSNKLESNRSDWELKLVEQEKKMQEMKEEISSLKQHVEEERSLVDEKESRIQSLSAELNDIRGETNENGSGSVEDRLMALEKALQDEKSKAMALESQNNKLQKLIGPYRHQLEMYEAESKTMNPKCDVDLVEKYTKLLDQQNQKQKVRQVIKLRNDVSQLKKRNDELTVENEKLRRSTSRIGKENRVFVKPKKALEAKPAMSEVPINSSPKVNRI